MGDSRNIEFTDLRLAEAGITAEEMAAADQLCTRADSFQLYAAEAVLHIHWNPSAPGLTEEIMVKLEEHLGFEVGFGAVFLREDESLEYPGAVLIGIDPGKHVDADTLAEMGQVIVAIASQYLKVSGSSIG